jgi:hypothetical protein
MKERRMRKNKNNAELINFLNKSKAIKVFPTPAPMLGQLKTAKKRVASHC